MFRAPFSFNGRIRRKEFGLSMIIYVVVILIIDAILIGMFGGEPATSAPVFSIVFLVVFIPMVWFVWAQGAKRCHDIGKSGWWQLIPFFIFWMLFEDGQRGTNQYGDDPKFPGEGQFSFEN